MGVPILVRRVEKRYTILVEFLKNMEVCVKASNKNSLHPLFSFLLSTIILGLVMSACSTPSGTITATNNNPTQGNAAAQSAGVTPTQTVHPIANQPPGAKKGTGGTPLPANEVKPLTFNLTYND